MAHVGIQWEPTTGKLSFAAQGMDNIQLLGIFRMCEHALLRQMSGGVGRPPAGGPDAQPSGSVRSDSLIARTVA